MKIFNDGEENEEDVVEDDEEMVEDKRDEK